MGKQNPPQRSGSTATLTMVPEKYEMFKKLAVTGGALMRVANVAPVAAQSCSGTGTCTVTSTASVAVPALVDLNVAGAGNITLTAPTVADLATGYVQDAGPSITVKAN